MGSLNDLPNNPASKAVSDQLIDDIKQNLQRFQQDLVNELTADVGRLQAEKIELLSTISTLKREQKELQAQQHTLLSQQQIAQQKLWAKQLSEALANRLYVLLAQRIEQRDLGNGTIYSGSGGTPAIAPTPLSGLSLASSPAYANGTTQKALQSLNQNVSAALGALQTDLNQANSPLVNQLIQGETIDAQGEVLLGQLVERLKQQLRSQPALPATAPNQLSGTTETATSPPQVQLPTTPPPRSLEAPPEDEVSPPVAPPPAQQPFMERWAEQLNLSHFQLGVILVLLSTIALSLHNVVVGIIGNESSLFNRFPEIGGVVTLASLDSSLLLLWLRMIIVVPLMAGVATFLYPPAWRDVKGFFMSRDRSLLLTVIGSGGFLFFSQVLIYIAIGQ
ncbi:MAG: hypothetical protein F6K16_34320, partial [Symploca sp. SIO2B6]|nr:hypothetical protein [Symploca sp. SIO2B6]